MKCKYLYVPIYKEEREGGKSESMYVKDQMIYSSPISLQKRKGREGRYIDSFIYSSSRARVISKFVLVDQILVYVVFVNFRVCSVRGNGYTVDSALT